MLLTIIALAMVVGACFLAQATYEYWYNSALDSTSYWYGYLDNHTSKSLIGRIWKAIKVAAVDTWAWITDCQVYEDYTGATHYWWYVPHANYVASEASSSVE